MNRYLPELLALAALLCAPPARAWNPEDVPVEAGVPRDVAARWPSEAKPGPGNDWDKYYFTAESGEERTVWCRHKDCDEVRRGADVSRRVPLYYLVPAGANGWQAVLSAYTIHWEPSSDGGLGDVISRAGTPLAIRPSRPWKKDDSWNLEGEALVLPPAGREVAPPNAALLVEAKDWPACVSLDPAAHVGAASPLKKLHPLEIEIEEADGADPKAPGARAAARGAAERELRTKPPSRRFDRFEARFLLCRIKRYDHFSTFRSEAAQTKDPAGFVAKWRRFVRGELSAYMKEADGKEDYRTALGRSGQRTLAALDGRAPEMAKARDRVESMLERMK